MDPVALLGTLAATCTTVAFIPQAIKIWRTRSAHDISLGMFVLSVVGVFLWMIYGLIRRDLPMIVSSAVTLVIATWILAMKLKYK